MEEYYLIIKALHIISVIAWMAGMLYLPRIFVYHCQVEQGSPTSALLKVMERRLLRYIINPAMIFSFIFGIMLISIIGMAGGWLHTKILLVLFLAGVHGMLAKYRKDFERDENTKSEKFYRILNEAPTLLMVVIVILAVVKPF
jgi:putative membrane protein